MDFKKYLTLIKPGIVRGNALAATAGFLLAANGHIQIDRGLGMLVGISLVVASACVCNNYLDRDIDKRMARTKKRALVTGSISTHAALGFAGALGLAGFLLLARYTNTLTIGLAAFGFVSYVFVYGYAKRVTVHSTLIGSFSGSAPLVVGYCAVTNRFDLGALLLFLIMMIWQMPHFFAISLYRRKDYQAAKVPVLSVKKSPEAVQRQIVAYIVLYCLTVPLLTLFGYTGVVYLVVMLWLGVVWLRFALKGYPNGEDGEAWAKRLFLLSIIILPVWCLLLGLNAWLI